MLPAIIYNIGTDNVNIPIEIGGGGGAGSINS